MFSLVSRKFLAMRNIVLYSVYLVASPENLFPCNTGGTKGAFNNYIDGHNFDHLCGQCGQK